MSRRALTRGLPARVTPSARARPARWRATTACPAPPHFDRRLRDAGLGVPEAARAQARAFLLESAEQGQRSGATRSSASGRGRSSAGRSATPATPTRSPPRPSRAGRRRRSGLPPFAGGAVGFFGYDLVRTVEPLGEPNPDPLGLPDMALMLTDVLVAFDHLKHTIDAARERLRRRARVRRAGLRGAPWRRSARSASCWPAPCPRPTRGRGPIAAPAVRVEHAARAVRGDGRPDRRVRPRRRRLPGRALPALVGRGPGRGVLDLPRAARRQPEPVHVLPGLRGLRGRRRLARAAADGHRPPRLHPADRRHAPARRDARGRCADRRGAARRREGARRARDARRPRPQRPRPRLRVRLGRRRRASWRSRPTRT